MRRPENCCNSNRLPATVATRLGSDGPRFCERPRQLDLAAVIDRPRLRSRQARRGDILERGEPLDPRPGACLEFRGFAGNRDEGAGRLLPRHDLDGTARIVGRLDQVTGVNALGHAAGEPTADSPGAATDKARSCALMSSPPDVFFSRCYTHYTTPRSGNKLGDRHPFEVRISPWRTAPRTGRVLPAPASGSSGPFSQSLSRAAPSKCAVSSTFPGKARRHCQGIRRRPEIGGKEMARCPVTPRHGSDFPLGDDRDARLAAGRTERGHDVEDRVEIAVAVRETLRPGEVVEGKRGDGGLGDRAA